MKGRGQVGGLTLVKYGVITYVRILFYCVRIVLFFSFLINRSPLKLLIFHTL